MPFLKLLNHRIHYNDTGEGEPLILLHNGFYSTQTWDPVRQQLAAHFRVLDYDRFGYGKSDRLDDTMVDGDIVEAGVEELEAFLDTLSLQKVCLAGHCLGGAVALLFAARHPKRVRRIVAASVGYFGSSRSILQTDMTFVPFKSIEPRLKRLMAEMHGEDYVEKFWSILSNDRRSYIMSETYDIRPEVRKVRAPLLLINGDRDFYFAPDHPISVYQKMRRTAALWIVPNCGHDVHMEQPEAFVQNVREFLLRRP